MMKRKNSLQSIMLPKERNDGTGISSPVFKRKNTSFSSQKEASLLLNHYKDTICTALTCAGMDNFQISNILVQIDFLLTDKQHDHLLHNQLLTEGNKTKLKHLVEQTTEVIEKQTETKAVIQIQSLARGWLIRKRLFLLRKEETSMLRIRASAFVELMRTETKFIGSLEKILQIYLTPISQNASKLNLGEAAVKYLTGNIQAMLDFHNEFIMKLDSVRDHRLYPVALILGNLMNEESANLRAHHMSYANNFIACIETLRHLYNTVSRFQSLLTELDNKSGESLEDLYEIPLTYLTNFSKRLRGIHVISFPAIETERQQLGRSIGIIESIDIASQKILEEQRADEAYENIKQTLIVELSLEGLPDPLLGTPNRKLLKAGPVRMSRKKNQCQVYLFNDVIIISEKLVNTNKFKFHRRIYPHELSVEEAGSKITLTIATNKKSSASETFSFKNNRSEKGEWLLALNQFVDTYRANCVYGTPLPEIIEREEIPEKIPFVMVICSKYIKEYGLATEGIFRVPGESYAVDTFQRLFDSGATEVDFRGCSVHDVATLLKLYLRMLPEPVIPFKAYPLLVAIQSRFEEDGKDDIYLQDTSSMIKEIPAVHRRVLKYLLSFLHEVSKHSKQTKMTSSNLALVFAPNIVRPEKDTVDTAMQSPIVQRILEYLIDSHEKIWEKAVQIDSSIGPELEVGSPVVNKHKKLQKVVSRYSMDAFDPMLCGEIPLPSTLHKSKKRVVTRAKGRRIPAGRFETLREISTKPAPPGDAKNDFSSSKEFNTLRVKI